MRVLFILLSTFILGSSGTIAKADAKNWQPERPIRVIVPWKAGGTTDLVTRVVAKDLEKELGQKLLIVNQPGGSGSIGSKSALDAPRDGYTWTAGAAKDLGTYIVTGKLDTKIEDWHLYLNSSLTCVVSVPANSPYKTFEDLLTALKLEGKKISVATAGVNSAGHVAIETIAEAADVKYKHVSFDGGNPAVVATVGGHTQVTTQLITDQIEMIRAKKLRPLAILADENVEIAGYGSIPAVTNWLDNIELSAIYFGIFVPKGVPQNVVETLDRIWTSRIAKSDQLKKYAATKGFVMKVQAGEEAQKSVKPSVQNAAWLLQRTGKAKINPANVGIEQPKKK